jgi:hypothetical protein
MSENNGGPIGVDPSFVRIIFREATLAAVFREAGQWIEEHSSEDGGLRDELVLYTTEVASLGDGGWELALYVSDDAGVFGGGPNEPELKIEVN